MSMSGRRGVVFSVAPGCAGERSESGDDGERPSGSADGAEGRALGGGGVDTGRWLSGPGPEGGAAGEPGRGIGGLGRGGSAMAAMIVDSAPRQPVRMPTTEDAPLIFAVGAEIPAAPLG